MTQKEPASLVWTAGWWIIAASILALLFQVAAGLYANYSDREYFERNYIKMEVDRLGAGLVAGPSGIFHAHASMPAHYNGPHGYHYAFRIRDQVGNTIATSNALVVENAFPVQGRVVSAPFTWQRNLETGTWFHVAGGLPYSIGEDTAWIEFATLGDPEHRRLLALAIDVSQRMLLPALPIEALTLAFAVMGVRRALRPLSSASRQVEVLGPAPDHLAIDHAALPHEVGVLTRAIERLLARNRELIGAQQRLLAHSAHELRTPLAMMLLELGRSNDPAAPRLAGDVRMMSETVNRLLALARIEALKAPPLKEVDLNQVVARAVANVGSLLDEHQNELSVVDLGAKPFKGDPTSVQDSVRNLLENAARHSPAGSRIVVTCGPGARLQVDDSGPGFPDIPHAQLLEPFVKGEHSTGGTGLGLAIVKKAVDLHGGRMTLGRSDLGGASVVISFGSA